MQVDWTARCAFSLPWQVLQVSIPGTSTSALVARPHGGVAIGAFHAAVARMVENRVGQELGAQFDRGDHFERPWRRRIHLCDDFLGVDGAVGPGAVMAIGAAAVLVEDDAIAVADFAATQPGASAGGGVGARRNRQPAPRRRPPAAAPRGSRDAAFTDFAA